MENAAVDYITGALDALVNNNLRLVVCFFQVFTLEKIFSNYAFIFTLSILCLMVLEFIIFSFFPCINNKTVVNIMNSDGSYLDFVREQEENHGENHEGNINKIISGDIIEVQTVHTQVENNNSNNRGLYLVDELDLDYSNISRNNYYEENRGVTEVMKNKISLSIDSIDCRDFSNINDNIKAYRNRVMVNNNIVIDEKNSDNFLNSKLTNFYKKEIDKNPISRNYKLAMKGNFF